jgi:hypothetical protein
MPGWPGPQEEPTWSQFLSICELIHTFRTGTGRDCPIGRVDPRVLVATVLHPIGSAVQGARYA